MTVKIRKQSRNGDDELNLSEEEAKRLVETEQGRYFIIDAETKKIVSPIQVQDGQELMFLPIVAGG